jgi:hypothetical protein
MFCQRWVRFGAGDKKIVFFKSGSNFKKFLQYFSNFRPLLCLGADLARGWGLNPPPPQFYGSYTSKLKFIIYFYFARCIGPSLICQFQWSNDIYLHFDFIILKSWLCCWLCWYSVRSIEHKPLDIKSTSSKVL